MAQHILTEAGDFLTTESGLRLITELPTDLGNTKVFNTYEVISGCYVFLDSNDSTVSICFIGLKPQVRFIDDSIQGPISSVPMVQGGDWLDITIDTANGPVLCKQIRYLGHNAPQSFQVYTHNAPFVTVYRNRSNPRVHTSPISYFSPAKRD